MSFAWWRTQILVLHLISRSSALQMSQSVRTYLPAANKQPLSSPKPPLPDSAEAPEIKKVKIDNTESSRNEDMSKMNVPSSARLCTSTSGKTVRTQITPRLDFPSSPVKISGPSVTCSSDVSSCSLSTAEDLKISTVYQAELALLEEGISANAQPVETATNALQESNILVDTSSAAGECIGDSEQEMELADSQTESGASVDNQSDSGWEVLPFFGSDQVDGDEEQTDIVAADGDAIERKSKQRRRKKPGATVKEKPKRVSPNAFVAVRIPSVDIRRKIEEVQEALLAQDERLKPTFVSTAKNHITLMVMRLNHEASTDIEKAKKVLFQATEKATKDLDLLNDPLVLNFSGLGNFSKNVLYANVQEGEQKERLIKMAGIVESVFVENEIATEQNSKNFVPHLTIAKMSKMATRKSKKRKKKKTKEQDKESNDNFSGIDQSTYAHLLGTEFGSQPIEGLELLSMTKRPDAEGYYYCFERHAFSSVALSSSVGGGESTKLESTLSGDYQLLT